MGIVGGGWEGYQMKPEWLARSPIAHRGLWDTTGHPENSLAAFRRAVSRGIPFEFDVQITREGQLVVVHDADLEQLTGQRIVVSDMDRSTLRRLRIGATGEHIPLLAEVLEIADGTPFIIDVRRWRGTRSPELERAVAAEIRGYPGPFALQSFDPMAVLRLRRMIRDHPVGQASGNLRSANRIVAALGRTMITNVLTRPAFISYELSELPSAWVNFWHRLGITVLAWTVQSASAEKQAVRMADNFFFDGYLPEGYTKVFPTTQR